MKLSKYIYAAAALLGTGLLAGCQNSFDAPEMEEPKATMTANTTIAELKEAFWQDDTNYAVECPYKDEDTKTPYIIKGRVISSDVAGNVYKAMYIQDETAAITISVNQSSLYTTYRIGQEVVLNVTGLYVGKYAGLMQIGGLGEYNGTPQVSFASYPIFEEHSELNGFPENNLTLVTPSEAHPETGIYAIVTEIGQLPTATADVRNMMSQFIELRNVHFQEGGTATYAEYQKNTSRNLVDESGNTIVVRTSGYSTFYNNILPTGTGTVRGLLSYYNSGWQLVLNSTADCDFESKGQKEDPYSVEEAIALQNTNKTGWVKGYIVGSVKAGVSDITSNDQIAWGADAEMDQTIVIAPNPECKDIAECLVMELPAGSSLRAMVNLLDNPGNVGKFLAVRGTFATFLGQNGVLDNKGTQSEFELEGAENGGGNDNPSTDDGDGSKEKPFTVAQAIKQAVANGETSTVEYYTAGYVISGSIGLDYGTGTFKIADNPSGTGEQLTVFRVKDLGNVKFTSATAVKAGDYIVVCAPLINYYGNTPETSYGYLYSINNSTSGGGDTPSTGGDQEGEGSQTSPYNVAYVMGASADQTGVWVEGYVVGSIDGKVWASDANFSGTPGSGYTNTNLILAGDPSVTSTSQAIPVQLPTGVRPDLGLTNNPSVYKKKVLLKGDITKYFGVYGFKNVSEYKILD